MLWPEKPMAWRLRRLTELGFACGIWSWTQHDLRMLESPGATFSSMTGYVRGRLADDEDAAELLATAREAIEVGKRLQVARLNLHDTGLGEGGPPVTPCGTVTGAMWLKARDTLLRIADLAEVHGVVFMLENLNAPVDHPGVPFGLARDTLALVSSIDRPGLRLNLDLYHAQIGEGNLIELCRSGLPWIGEIQAADVPGRMEPGTGEICYAGIARALNAMGYRGPVCLEAFASGDTETALEVFRPFNRGWLSTPVSSPCRGQGPFRGLSLMIGFRGGRLIVCSEVQRTCLQPKHRGHHHTVPAGTTAGSA